MLLLHVHHYGQSMLHLAAPYPLSRALRVCLRQEQLNLLVHQQDLDSALASYVIGPGRQ